MNDSISRQAAIDGILHLMPPNPNMDDGSAEQLNFSAWKCALTCAEASIKMMPSAQPKSSESKRDLSDTISRQAAIDAVKSRKTAEQSSAGIMRNAVVDFCVDIIKKLPSAQPEKRTETHACDYEHTETNAQWIPVSERLPERGKDVLVTRDYDGRADHIKSCRYVEVASCYGEDDDVSWNSYSDEYKMTPKNHRVVAWMPLPEPWKGE